MRAELTTQTLSIENIKSLSGLAGSVKGICFELKVLATWYFGSRAKWLVWPGYCRYPEQNGLYGQDTVGIQLSCIFLSRPSHPRTPVGYPSVRYTSDSRSEWWARCLRLHGAFVDGVPVLLTGRVWGGRPRLWFPFSPWTAWRVDPV